MIHWGFELLENILPPALWTTIHRTYCNPAQSTYEKCEGINFYNGHTGEKLFQAPPAVMRRVTRQKMRKHISQGLDIQWNSQLESFTDNPDGGVTLSFASGATADADIVIGADGPRSKTRQLLLGEEAAALTKSDFVCGYSSAVVGRDNAKALYESHPVWTMAYHSMGVAAIGGSKIKRSP
jgi:2-polyprenyl-6-methoxyphenol hydroxylase-like FAD-dependent oxidoreductase